VFTSGLPDWSRAKSKLDGIVNAPPWRTHDLRRTTATGLQKLGTPLQVTEAILGHTAGSRAGVVGIYQRHDYASEKRAALEAWGAHVMALVEGREPGKVLPMRGKR
jgi:integrase